MGFDLTTHLASAILDLALRRGEGVLDRHQDMLVLLRVAVRFADDDVFMVSAARCEYRS